jgi:NADH-quinone oxidoreductase subunit C/D
MFSWKEFEKIQNIFSEAASLKYRHQASQHHVDVRPKDFQSLIDLLKDDLGYLTLVDIAGVTGELVYLFLNMGTHQRINVHLRYEEGDLIPSIQSSFSHGEWMERELTEKLNLNLGRKLAPLILSGSEKRKPFPPLRYNPNKSEAPYPEESYKWAHYDLWHPQSIGAFELNICFDPARAVSAQADIGFFHSGLETQFLKKNWMQIMQLADGVHPGAAPTYSIAWAKNLEDVHRIKLPERAQAIRIILLELARVNEHLTILFEVTKALNLAEASLLLNLREKVLELFEKYGGTRMGLGFTRLGGVREDLPHGWIIEYQAVHSLLLKHLPLILSSLLTQSEFKANLQNDPFNAQSALQWGVTGPAMRASGLNFDLRKSQPFYFYQEIDFDVPVGIHGTSFDRFLIRYEEILQSFRIMTQVVDNLPLGEIVARDLSLEDFKEHKEWHYSALESPNGEAGFIHQSGKIKIRTPAFALAQAIPKLTVGLTPGSLKASLLTLGIRTRELDR